MRLVWFGDPTLFVLPSMTSLEGMKKPIKWRIKENWERSKEQRVSLLLAQIEFNNISE